MSKNKEDVLIESLILLEEPVYNLVSKCKMTDKEARKFIAEFKQSPEFEMKYNALVEALKTQVESKDTILIKMNSLYTNAKNAGKQEVAIKVLDQIAKWNNIEQSEMSFKIILEDATTDE